MFDVFDIDFSRTIKDGYFGTVDLNEAVVHAEGIEGSQGMFDGGTAGVSTGQHSAACGFHDILGDGVDDGFVWKIDTLYLIPVVFGSGVESDDEVKARVETFSMQRKAAT